MTAIISRISGMFKLCSAVKIAKKHKSGENNPLPEENIPGDNFPYIAILQNIELV